MGAVVSLIVIAVGAILTFAITREASGVDIDLVGWILMIVGFVGLVLSIIFWSSVGGYGITRRDTYVREDPYDRRPL
jgi:Na+/proline symporter